MMIISFHAHQCSVVFMTSFATYESAMLALYLASVADNSSEWPWLAQCLTHVADMPFFMTSVRVAMARR